MKTGKGRGRSCGEIPEATHCRTCGNPLKKGDPRIMHRSKKTGDIYFRYGGECKSCKNAYITLWRYFNLSPAILHAKIHQHERILKIIKKALRMKVKEKPWRKKK